MTDDALITYIISVLTRLYKDEKWRYEKISVMSTTPHVFASDLCSFFIVPDLSAFDWILSAKYGMVDYDSEINYTTNELTEESFSRAMTHLIANGSKS